MRGQPPSNNYNITLEEWNHDKDHVHILFRDHPNTEISKFINAYKSASSRLLKKEFPQIRQKLWKDYFWSQSKQSDLFMLRICEQRNKRSCCQSVGHTGLARLCLARWNYRTRTEFTEEVRETLPL